MFQFPGCTVIFQLPLAILLSPGTQAPDWDMLQKDYPALSQSVNLDWAQALLLPEERGLLWFHIEPEQHRIILRQNDSELRWESDPDASSNPKRYWRPWEEIQPHTTENLPLLGLRVALDPGHVGGEFAATEHRFFHIEGADFPVAEGDLNRIVARRLEKALQKLGAIVSWTNKQDSPLTAGSPEDYKELAKNTLSPMADWETLDSDQQAARIRNWAVRYWLIIGDIRERARLVNEEIQPDLVLSIHFDAAPWPENENGTLQLVPESFAHIIVNGSYLEFELALEDVRADFMRRLLQNTPEEEVHWGLAMADALRDVIGSPAFTYRGRNAVNVQNHPYLWGRNLLANRLFEAPTLFLEPFVMNSKLDHSRIQKALAGEAEDDDIFDQYVEFVLRGLLNRRQK